MGNPQSERLGANNKFDTIKVEAESKAEGELEDDSEKNYFA
jgi:hypothetical protein